MNGCIYCNEYDVCMKYTTDKATSFCAGRNCRDRKPSNSDRIREMTDEELARFISCPEHNDWRTTCLKDDGCLMCRTKWLKQEAADADSV